MPLIGNKEGVLIISLKASKPLGTESDLPPFTIPKVVLTTLRNKDI